MSMDLQNQTSDTPKQPKQPDAELEISPPLTAAPSSSMVSAGGRHKLYQHAEMLEKENESLNQQLIKMQSEIERMSSTEQSANNRSILTLENRHATTRIRYVQIPYLLYPPIMWSLALALDTASRAALNINT